jgi:hypothetical protein
MFCYKTTGLCLLLYAMLSGLGLANTPEPWTFVSWADPHIEVADLSGTNPAGIPAAAGYLSSTSNLHGTTDEMEAM